MCKAVETPTDTLAASITRILATSHDDQQRQYAIYGIASVISSFANKTPRTISASLPPKSDLDHIVDALEMIAEFSEKWNRQSWESAVWKNLDGWPLPDDGQLQAWFDDCVSPDDVPDLWDSILNDNGRHDYED